MIKWFNKSLTYGGIVSNLQLLSVNFHKDYKIHESDLLSAAISFVLLDKILELSTSTMIHRFFTVLIKWLLFHPGV